MTLNSDIAEIPARVKGQDRDHALYTALRFKAVWLNGDFDKIANLESRLSKVGLTVVDALALANACEILNRIETGQEEPRRPASKRIPVTSHPEWSICTGCGYLAHQGDCDDPVGR